MSAMLDLLDYIPPQYYQELLDLQDVPQDPKNHPEGDAYQHTILVVEAAENIAIREQLNGIEYMTLILAAFAHDFGKVSTTEIHSDGRITAYGHDEASVPLAQAFIERMTVNEDVKAAVIPLVRYHMAHIAFNPVTNRAVRRLAKKLYPATIEMWALLVEADHSGRPPLKAELPAKAQIVLDIARGLGISNGDLSSLR